MEKYSKKLFDELFEKVSKELNERLTDSGLKFKGLWAFSYLEGANILQSVYFNHILKADFKGFTKKIIRKIETTPLDCDYGSLGPSFSKLKNNKIDFVKFLPYTFNDPQGTVCYYDTIINQQHACFVIIKNDKEILGALDFYFEGTINANQIKQIKDYFIQNKGKLNPFAINAFKIHEHEYFLEIQEEKGKKVVKGKEANKNDSSKANIQSAIKHIERVIAMSSKTPLMIIKHNNSNATSSLVCLNFDFIHSIIKHENRFCPLTDGTKHCFHFKDFTSFSNNSANLCCTNDFLNNYYYKVFAALDAKFLHQQIYVDATEYGLDIVSKNNSQIGLIKKISVNKEINNLPYEGLSALAKEKYQDERVFMNVEKQLKNNKDIYAFSLSRVKPSIKCTIKCSSGETDCKVRNTNIGRFHLKQFISPSTILPIQHGVKKNKLFLTNDSKDSNIIHFTILEKSEKQFIDALKRLIAKKPDDYIDFIKPYIDNKNPARSYEQLSLKYAGSDPLKSNKYAEIIRGKLNLIEAILQGEESEYFATRAAISQVMARNKSHNIGSHVSYKSTNTQIKQRIKELKIDNNLTDDNIISWIDFVSGKLDKYEIYRDEYLADYSLSPKSFLFYSDLILPFCENTLIMDNLASSEGASYSDCFTNKLKIRVYIKKNGFSDFKEIKASYLNLQSFNDPCKKLVCYPDYFPYLLIPKCTNDILQAYNSKEVTKDLDVEVLLHSDQGFYSILENFVRNSAKHNKNEVINNGLEVKIYLEEKEGKYLLTLTDNVSKLSGSKLFNVNQNELGLFQRIKSGIQTDGSAPQNLGFVDMNVNSFLFKYRSTDISKKSLSDNFHLVSVNDSSGTLIFDRIDSKIDGNEIKFGYQIELLKPTKVLWIGEDIQVSSELKISSLKNNGIVYFRDLDEYVKEYKADKKEIVAFDFAIFYKSFESENYIQEHLKLPVRILRFPKNSQTDDLQKPNICNLTDESFAGISDADDLLERCWQMWLHRIDKKINAYIYYEAPPPDDPFAGTNLNNNLSIKCVNTLSIKTEVSNEEITVIYDHHGNAIGQNLYLKVENYNPVTNFYTRHTKIYFDKGSADFVPLTYLPTNEHKKKLLIYELMDAATTNVFILDERIAMLANKDNTNKNDKEFGMKNSKYGPLVFSRQTYSKIFAINKIKLDQKDAQPIHAGELKYDLILNIDSNKLKLLIENQGSKLLSDIDKIKKDILVIHRTYLKKESLGMEVKDFLRLAQNQFGSVVITSGGGFPHNLDVPVRFIPFSIIENCINERISKLKLINSLQKITQTN